MNRREEHGFTLVEVMIALFLFSVLSVGFYQVMFSSVRGSNVASDVAEVAEEARLGFNRMIRDTRETTQLVTADDDSYRIWSDFDQDGVVDGADIEYMEYAFDDAGSRITLRALTAPAGGDPDLFTGTEATLAGTEIETLAANVDDIGVPVFTYVSNFLIYDTVTVNGEVTLTELETGLGRTPNGVVDGIETMYVSDINYSFEVVVNDQSRTFYGQAQIRNRRFSDL